MRKITLGLLFVVASACVIRRKPPMYTMLPVPTLQVHDRAEVTQDGIIVTVTPITNVNGASFPQVYKTLNISASVDETDPLTGAPTGRKTQGNIQVSSAIVPLPAFHVRIVNDTGHVIRLTGAVFRLEDNTGKKYPTYSGTRELLAWNEATTAASTSDPAIQAQILQQTERAIDSLQLLNRTVELLKGDEWSGFLVFNLGTEPDVYTTIMHSVERFKLRLAEFPVETDDAGQVTRTTEFTFSIEKTTKEVDAECPGGTGDTVVGCVQAGRCTPVDAGTVAEIRGRVQKLVAGEAPGGFVSKILGRELGL